MVFEKNPELYKDQFAQTQIEVLQLILQKIQQGARIVIVRGLSGVGKDFVLRFLEQQGIKKKDPFLLRTNPKIEDDKPIIATETIGEYPEPLDTIIRQNNPDIQPEVVILPAMQEEEIF